MSSVGQKKARATVTLDPELVGRVKRRVGERGVSAYLNAALRRELRHEAMREYLERTEREYGPIDSALLEKVQHALDHSYDEVDRLRSRRKAVSALVKPVAPKGRKSPAVIARRAKAALEKAFGDRVSIEAISDEAFVVRLSAVD